MPSASPSFPTRTVAELDKVEKDLTAPAEGWMQEEARITKNQGTDPEGGRAMEV